MEPTITSNAAVLSKYMDLPQDQSLSKFRSVIAEYVWVDATGGVRSKSRTLRLPKPTSDPSSSDSSHPKPNIDLESLPIWNFDGSSTSQAPTHDSDVYLKPVAFYPDPFRRGDNILVMCECYDEGMQPNFFNNRHAANLLMTAHEKEKFWFGLEQEYTLLDFSGWPYGWPKNGYPAPQGPYYCGVGTGKVFCRDIVEAHYKACLYAGINISGVNAEVMPAQWEFQVGPCAGIDLGDQLWMARFLLHRVAEDFGAKVTFAPKPIPGDWNGAGLHSNVSTEAMRQPGGYQVIEEAMEKLAARHADHMAVYGEDNDLRMTGRHETAQFDKFSWGVANRGSSVRISRQVAADGRGYFEDRRPASNADPYQVTAIIVETLCGPVEGAVIAKADPLKKDPKGAKKPSSAQ